VNIALPVASSIVQPVIFRACPTPGPSQDAMGNYRVIDSKAIGHVKYIAAEFHGIAVRTEFIERNKQEFYRQATVADGRVGAVKA
jgi:hypothetical protein